MKLNPYRTRGEFYCNDRHKVAFLRIHKCACTSIASFLAQLKTPQAQRPLWIPQNASVNFDRVTRDEREVANYFTFAFIRNPFDRFLSFYKNWIISPPHCRVLENYKELGLRAGMPFAQCVRSFVRARDVSRLDPHTAPLYTFLYRDNRLRVKYIGKVERAAADFRAVQAVCGTTERLPHANRREGADLYDAESRALIHEFYRKDFELFDYAA